MSVYTGVSTCTHSKRWAGEVNVNRPTVDTLKRLVVYLAPRPVP